MFPVLQVGPASLPVPGLIIIISLWIGINLAEKLASKFNIQPNIIFNSIALGFVCGILGARIAFVFLHLGEFIQDPRAALSLNFQLLDFWGGILVACLAIFIYGQRKDLNWNHYANAVTPILAVFFVALPISELASGDHYGLPTNLPWAINLWGLERHPTQVYDFLASGLIMIWLLTITIKSGNGNIRFPFLIFVALTAFSRLVFDGFEADSNLFLGEFRSGQMSAWIIMATAMFTYYILDRKEKSLPA